MLILSHRGYWNEGVKKNTGDAFKRSFELGFGTETDIRDYCGKLVISHDVPDLGVIDFEDFLKLYAEHTDHYCLALNIKSDGLQDLLLSSLNKNNISNYFVFDMSVPDALVHLDKGLKVFTRESEFEKEPSFYDQADGVWIDQMRGNWLTKERIQYHLDNGKKICIVSPELHQREYLNFWKECKEMCKELKTDDMMLCTDLPEEARRFFHD